MRFWLILLQLAVVCLLISIIGFVGEMVVTDSGKPASVAVAEGAALGAAFLALQALRVYLYTGAMATSAVASIWAALQPFFLFVIVCFACAVLAGYKRLWWIRWIGFVLNLGVGLFLLAAAGKDSLITGVLASLYFLAQAVLFFLLPPIGDAARIKKSATMLHPVLGVIGLGLGVFAFINSKSGVVTILLTVLFYAVAFFLHFRVSKTIQLQPKPLVKAFLTLALTLAVLVAFFIVRPIMAGPLMLSWLSIPLYIEALALSKFRADVPYAGWRHQVRKTVRVLMVLTILAGAIAGGITIYKWYVTLNLPSAESLKSTDGLRSFHKFDTAASSKIVLIPLSELPPHIANAAKSSPRDYFWELGSLVIKLTGESLSGYQRRSIRDDIKRNLTEDEALSAYLALVGYGSDAYGISAAAETYYNKTLAELDMCEAATLVNLGSPTLGAEVPHSKKRELNSVLQRMVGEGYITEDDIKMCLKDD